jgi:2-dehydropantoate 2-reductase
VTDRQRVEDDDQAGPLHGLKVLDLGTVYAAPITAMLLGDFGANVVKVELPAGDPARTHGYSVNGHSLWWKVIARNKTAMTLDVRSPRGRDILLKLVADSDALVENFRPGVLEGWGVGPDRLHEVNPRLIVLRTTGFGQTGPYARRRAFGTLAEAMTGFAHQTGQPDGPPTLPSFGLADGLAGVTGAFAVMTALYQRENGDGRGEVIDLSLIEPLLGPDTAVLAAQNGIPWWYFHKLSGPYEGRRIEAVDPGGATTAVLAPERAIGCVVYPATTIEAPGVIRHLEGTRFSIGEPSGEISARCQALSDAMVAGGLKAPVEADLRSDIWIKLMGNVAFNPLSALTRATMVEICQNPRTRQIVVQLMEETLDIAARVGAKPDISIEKRLRGAENVGHHKTSMLQDLEAGKPLELDAIVTAVVEMADLTGAAAPTLRTIHAATDLLARTCVPDTPVVENTPELATQPVLQ